MRFLVLVVLLAVPAVARGDVFMWRDGDGVTHFTNSRKLIPEGAVARVLFEEEPAAVRAEPAPPPAEVASEAAPAGPVVVYDQSALEAAFAEGWRHGMAALHEESREPRIDIRIGGPVMAGGAQGLTVVAPDAYGWGYPSLVTTSFDRGRSRHLTLRLLMQDQFALDRGGPYRYIDRIPPRGPNLAAFLPRGLPMTARPGPRVITY